MDTQQHPAGTLPATDLLRRFVDYAQQTFIPALASLYPGGAAHVGSVSALPDDLMPRHVGAFFITANPSGEVVRALAGGPIRPITAMYVTMETAMTVAAALEGGSQGLPPSIRRAVLRDLKTELKFVVHEATHSIGPIEIEAYDREVEATARAGLGPWKEAVTELATSRNLDAVIRAARLESADPWLLEVGARDTGSYVGMVEAAATLIDGLSRLIPGSTPGGELRDIVAGGCGQSSLDAVFARLLGTRGVAAVSAVSELRAMVAETMSRLDRTYKRTLSELDNADPLTVSTELDRLRREGSQAGLRLVEHVERSVAASHHGAARVPQQLSRAPSGHGALAEHRGKARAIDPSGLNGP